MHSLHMKPKRIVLKAPVAAAVAEAPAAVAAVVAVVATASKRNEKRMNLTGEKECMDVRIAVAI